MGRVPLAVRLYERAHRRYHARAMAAAKLRADFGRYHAFRRQLLAEMGGEPMAITVREVLLQEADAA